MPPRNKKPTEETVKFTFDAKPDVIPNTVDALTAAFRGEPLAKSIKPNVVKRDLKERYAGSKIVFDSRDYANTMEGVDEKLWRRLSDAEQKEIAQIDPYVSAIISTRCSQSSTVGRPSDSKFDRGTRISEIKPLSLDDFASMDEFKVAQRQRRSQFDAILRWVLECGTNNEEVIDAAFADTSDRNFRKCNLSEFLSAQIRNLMVFGRCGTYIFRNEDGLPIMFRPVAIETIYNATYGYDIPHMNARETTEESKKDLNDFNIMPETVRPNGYIQRIEGRNINFFSDYDLKVSYLQKQAYFDLHGYPLSPIEQALMMVFIHTSTLTYLRNQFIKGLATKGILNLESTDPTAQLADEDLAQLRREFHNFVSRNDNSAAIPVISGPVKVNFVPLSPGPQDVGFLQLEEMIIRALCSSFQISPQEMGYGNLSSTAQGSLNQSGHQGEIIQGEERGLRCLLDTVYDLVNEIVFENFPEAKKICRIVYTGVGEDTRDTVIERGIQELQTTATLSGLWAASEKQDPVPYGGSVPLAPLFHANVARYMPYGKFMEMFFGEKGWSKLPEYDFIIDPNLNSAYQALKVQPIEKQKEGADMALEGQKQQLAASDQQMQASQAAQQMQQTSQDAEVNKPADEEPEPSTSSNTENDDEAEKSLRTEYSNRKKLKKSMTYYFSEWTNLHK